MAKSPSALIRHFISKFLRCSILSNMVITTMVISPLDDHKMCSICGHRFATPRTGVRGDRDWLLAPR